MRLISAASVVFVTMVIAVCGFGAGSANQLNAAEVQNVRDARVDDGKTIFRFDTFGDEQLWTDVLRMHEALQGVDPATALSVGLKVDVDALPADVIAALQAGDLKLTEPAVTRALLRLNAVVGVKGIVNDADQITSIGVTCALCHSTVDNSFMPGVGHRLDGWANSDLDVGKIVSLSPSPLLDDATKAEFVRWGPGKYDPRHHAFNGTNLIPLPMNSPSLPVVIPPAYGLKGVGFETYNGDGAISYWNSYVGVGQMGGQGNFNDPRLPLTISQTPDLVTPKLPALFEYQSSLRTPKAPKGSFNQAAADRGDGLFHGQAGCAACHKGSTFTDVLSGPDKTTPFLHDASEVGMDPTYAEKSATGISTGTAKYRTTPLRGLQQRRAYFHDGSAPDLLAVVNHYDSLFGLGLTDAQKADLVEYLKSL